MTKVIWDAVGARRYETGVDHGVLYIPDEFGVYGTGVAWNGLTTVTESPTGAESNPQYADNIKYLDLQSAEQFEATIEAMTYPPEFEQCDGISAPTPGVAVGQQNRKPFGFCYRTIVGNDLQKNDYGYKLHLVYGALAAPSEQAHATVNDSPEAVSFSWSITTTPVAVTGLKPTATITVDSTMVDPDALAALEELLYGTSGTDPSLPMPDDVIALFSGTITVVTPTAPTYNGTTHVITIPSVTGVIYKINGVVVTTPQTITEDTIVNAVPDTGYVFTDPSDSDWFFDYS
jgi:hypothetical protein